MSLKSYSFSKEERLKSKKEISRVFKDGIFLYEKHLSVVFIPADEVGQNRHRVAVSVPKKYFKRAVDRNRIKRQLRECYRLNKSYLYLPELTPSLNMMFVYISKTILSYSRMNDEIIALIQRVLKKLSD